MLPAAVHRLMMLNIIENEVREKPYAAVTGTTYRLSG